MRIPDENYRGGFERRIPKKDSHGFPRRILKKDSLGQFPRSMIDLVLRTLESAEIEINTSLL